MQKKYSKALKEIKNIPDTPEHSLHLGIMKAIAENGLGNKEKGQKILGEILQKYSDNTAVYYYQAIACAEYGQNEKALNLLERAFEKKDDRMVWIKIQPEFAGLRNTPRFQELLKKMRLI
jgi:predicted Zn-dependent protease